MPAFVPRLLLLAVSCCAFTLGCSDDQESDSAVVSGSSRAPGASPTTIPLVDAATICASDAAPSSVTVASPDIIEASGIAASRTQPGVVWAHNDSGDTARVFAINEDGSQLAAYDLRGADAVDWEDMAIGPGPERGTDYLYLADIGDNVMVREALTIYRLPEPIVDPASSQSAIDNVDALTLRYRDGAHDAETLLADPISGDLLIVTKELATGISGVYRAPASRLVPDQTITMEREAEIDFMALRSQKDIPPGSPPLANVAHAVTGGDISPDGTVIALRTYSTVWVWDRFPSGPVVEAFPVAPCEGPSEIEAQGEAIAFDRTGTSYYTVSEGEHPPLYRFRFD